MACFWPAPENHRLEGSVKFGGKSVWLRWVLLVWRVYAGVKYLKAMSDHGFEMIFSCKILLTKWQFLYALAVTIYSRVMQFRDCRGACYRK